MLRVTLTGASSVTETLNRLEVALDTTHLLDEAGAILLTRIRRRFLDQTDPDGVAWPVSRAALRRQSTGRGGGTLYDTGRLFRSIQLHKRGYDSRAIATDVPYAPDHNQGKNRQVRRVFLGFGENDTKVVTSFIIQRVRRALNGNR